jgi:hypothetical protein
MMKKLLPLSTSSVTLLLCTQQIIIQAYALSDETTSGVGGTDATRKKKKIDIRSDSNREEQHLQFASSSSSSSLDRIPKLSNDEKDDEFEIWFHNRQIEKRQRLEQMHNDISEKLAAHHSGRHLLSKEELALHTKRLLTIERKRKSVEEESPEKYSQRMKRHEEKFLKKIERKDKRREERLKKMAAAATAGVGEL